MIYEKSGWVFFWVIYQSDIKKTQSVRVMLHKTFDVTSTATGTVFLDICTELDRKQKCFGECLLIIISNWRENFGCSLRLGPTGSKDNLVISGEYVKLSPTGLTWVSNRDI